jgi:hypothetical protein
MRQENFARRELRPAGSPSAGAAAASAFDERETGARVADQQLELAAAQGEHRVLGSRRLERLDGGQLAARVASEAAPSPSRRPARSSEFGQKRSSRREVPGCASRRPAASAAENAARSPRARSEIPRARSVRRRLPNVRRPSRRRRRPRADPQPSCARPRTRPMPHNPAACHGKGLQELDRLRGRPPTSSTWARSELLGGECRSLPILPSSSRSRTERSAAAASPVRKNSRCATCELARCGSVGSRQAVHRRIEQERAQSGIDPGGRRRRLDGRTGDRDCQAE